MEDEKSEASRERFTQLVSPYIEKAKKKAREILTSEEDCSDAFQESLLKAWLSMDQIQDLSNFEGWFMSILRRTCFDMRRKECHNRLLLNTILHNQKSSSKLNLPFFEMKKEYRELLFFRYIYGYSKQEIMDYFNLSDGAYKNRMSRARRQLKILCKGEFE